MNVLFIDDNPAEKEFIRRKINHKNVDLICHDNLPSARVSLAHKEYDLIITDFHLNGGTANELIEFARLGKRSKNKDTRIIVISASVIHSRVSSLEALDGVEFMEKPIDYKVVFDRDSVGKNRDHKN